MAPFAYVTNTGSLTVSVIDLATNMVVASPATSGISTKPSWTSPNAAYGTDDVCRSGSA